MLIERVSRRCDGETRMVLWPSDKSCHKHISAFVRELGHTLRRCRCIAAIGRRGWSSLDSRAP